LGKFAEGLDKFTELCELRFTLIPLRLTNREKPALVTMVVNLYKMFVFYGMKQSAFYITIYQILLPIRSHHWIAAFLTLSDNNQRRTSNRRVVMHLFIISFLENLLLF